MGSPMPKREAERRRRNKTTEAGIPIIAQHVPVVAQDMEIRPVEMPEADPKWHPLATDTYESFGHSGMRVFYEPSDWARLKVICDQLSQHLKPQFCGINETTGEVVMSVKPMTGATLTAVLRGFSGAGASEGDRRTMRVELERGATLPDPDASDADIVQLRSGLV